MASRRTVLAVLICLALWPIAAQAQNGPRFTSDRLQIVVDQQPLVFAPLRVNGELYVAADDPALPQLLTQCGASFNWSEDGTALFVHQPGGDATWDVGSDTGTIRGKSVTITAGIIRQDGKLLVRADALVELLGQALIPQSGDGAFVMLPTITDVQLQTEQGASTLVLVANGRLSWAAEDEDGGKLTLRFPSAVCSLPQDQFAIGDVTVTVRNRGGVSGAADIQLTFPPHWKGVVGSRLVMDQCVVHECPDYPSAVTQTNTTLASITLAPSENGVATLQLQAPSTFAWAWRWNGTDQLIVDVLHATPTAAMPEVPTGCPIAGIDTTVMNTDPYPVTRFTLKVAPGCGFALQKVDAEDVKTLQIVVGPLDRFPIAHNDGVDGFIALVRGVIVLDPGHGGGDPGRHSPYSGVQEKECTLDICLKMRKLLEARGWKVLMTREDDRDSTWPGSPDASELGARTGVANSNECDIFVSVHCNASVSSVYRGTTIHWFKSEDYTLAHALHEALGESLGVPMEGLVHSRFYVLRHTSVPAVLVETAYLTNPSDSELLSDDKYRSQVAQHLADALSQYMVRQNKLSNRGSRSLIPASLR